MKKLSFPLVFLYLLLIGIIQCGKDSATNISDTMISSDSLKVEQKEEKAKEIIRYSEFIFPAKNKDSAMAVFREKYSESERYIILALNRLDEKNAWRSDTLMIPDKFENDFLKYSPFPSHLDILNDVNKFVVFSYPIQAYAVYQKGNLVKWGPTSMGKKSAQTKRGLMFTNWKKELSVSTVNRHWKLPYNFNIHNTLGIGWHQFDLPGFPASHSCLRLLMDDAKWMYNFGDQWILEKGGHSVKAKGTPVVVFGDFDWDGKKPWKRLSENPDITTYSAEQLNAEIQPFKAEILQEQQKREDVLAQIQLQRTEEITE